jgi:hypothetical protein
VVEKLAALRLTKGAELVGTPIEETLTHCAFPEEHWAHPHHQSAKRGAPPTWPATSPLWTGMSEERCRGGNLRSGH